MTTETKSQAQVRLGLAKGENMGWDGMGYLSPREEGGGGEQEEQEKRK